MTQIPVLLMEFDFSKRAFHALREITLPAIPNKGDRIALHVDGNGYMFEVYDVHYGEGGIDINIVRRCSLADFYNSGFPDIS